MNEPSRKLHRLDELFRASRIVDLSVLLEKGMPRWPTHPPIVIDRIADHDRDGYANQLLMMGEHTGTHVDAPVHMHGDQAERTVDTIEPGELMGIAKVIDLSHRDWQPGERAELEDVLAALARTQTVIEEGDIVLVNFGWLRRYWTTGREWTAYAANQPGFTEAVADYMMERGIRAIGTDTSAVGTPVVDGRGERCFFHERVLARGIYLIECLANLEQLPPECFFTALPLKIAGGTGSPVRAVAWVM